MKDFDFYVGGIEDAMLQSLEAEMRELGVKTFATYSGELSDPDNLKKALSALVPKFPLVMVAYTDGKDVQLPATFSAFGAAQIYQHECSFAVICASNDSRGEKARRRGVGARKIGTYQMLAKVREILSNLQIYANLQIENQPDESVLLTLKPLTPSATEFIARIPEVTAYAEIFDTYFKWETRDRREAGTAVSQVIIQVERTNTPTELPTDTLPGTKLIGG